MYTFFECLSPKDKKGKISHLKKSSIDLSHPVVASAVFLDDWSLWEIKSSLKASGWYTASNRGWWITVLCQRWRCTRGEGETCNHGGHFYFLVYVFRNKEDYMLWLYY